MRKYKTKNKEYNGISLKTLVIMCISILLIFFCVYMVIGELPESYIEENNKKNFEVKNAYVNYDENSSFEDGV